MESERLVKIWEQLLKPNQFTGDGCCPQVFTQVESLFPNPIEYPRVCDIGCGDGYWIKKLKEKGYKTCGLDLCYEGKELDIIKGDMHFTPYEHNQFDWIFCNQTWEHSIAPILLTIELNRITKLNGFVFLTIPSELSTWVYDKQHYSCFPKQCVEALFNKCGFNLVKYLRVSERPSGKEEDVMQIFLFRKEIEVKR